MTNYFAGWIAFSGWIIFYALATVYEMNNAPYPIDVPGVAVVGVVVGLLVRGMVSGFED